MSLYHRLNKYFLNNIRLSFVQKEYVFIITNNDMFYRFKRNDIRSHLIKIINHEFYLKILIENNIVRELCHKNIIDIKINSNEMNFLTKESYVYSWNDFKSNTARPELRSDLKDILIK